MRPWAYGDVWDKMTPKERRKAVLWDLLLGFGGALAIYTILEVIK